jgi:hypothetical protein
MWTLCGIVLCLIIFFCRIFTFSRARNIHHSGISMGSILPLILEDLFLERMVILEGTFDKVIAELLDLHLMNIDGSQIIRYHPKRLARFQAMRFNQHYAAHAIIFSI